MAHVRIYKGRRIISAVPEGDFMVVRLKGKRETIRITKAEYDRDVTRVERSQRR